MGLLQRIPPLVSALAFGYGAGMAAPESTVASMQAAVTAYQGAGAETRAPAAAAPPSAPPQVVFGRPLGGSESGELARLRERQVEERGDSCRFDRPLYSRAPRYESSFAGDERALDEIDTAGTEALSRLVLPDLKVAVGKRTLRYVKFFARTDRGRGMFESWLKRSGRYQDLIRGELREWQLPEDLMWVAMIESGFDPRAKSPAGAVGLWQFMPATGAVYGLTQGPDFDLRKNPSLATKAAAHHLRDLYMRFGAWDLALAAYNMGYEQLLDAIDRYGTTDFNELARQEAIPSETASYVPKITAAAIIANNLEHFGFDRVELTKAVDVAEIAAPAGMPLKTLAKAAGVSTSQIRAMNPDILGERVPRGRGDFLLSVPADSLARAQASLPALLETDKATLDDADVLDPVDLLGGSDFVRKPRGHGADESLLSLLPPPKRRARALRDALGDDRADPLIDALGGVSDDGDDGDDEPRRRVAAKNRRQTILYRVGAGDTLIGVARQFAADIEDVARDNKLDVDDKLRAGALLKLRVRPDMVHLAETGAAEPEKKGDDGPAKAKGRGRGEPSEPAKAEDRKPGRGAKAATRRSGKSPS
jgi:membrane-bound lytic murein transglycosylase D